MSGNDKSSSRDFGDSSQFTNCILYSGETCHITPQVSYFIPGLLEDTDKYIEVADRYHVTDKQKVRFKYKMCDTNGYPFIVILHNIILAPDLCDMLSSINKLMNLGHTCLFHKKIHGLLCR